VPDGRPAGSASSGSLLRGACEPRVKVATHWSAKSGENPALSRNCRPSVYPDKRASQVAWSVGGDKARRGNELVAGATPCPRSNLDQQKREFGYGTKTGAAYPARTGRASNGFPPFMGQAGPRPMGIPGMGQNFRRHCGANVCCHFGGRRSRLRHKAAIGDRLGGGRVPGVCT
jgi:hypothetical protein